MVLKVREVERRDVDQMLVMWQDMMAESPHYRIKTFNEQKARALLSRMYASLSPSVFGLVVEDESGALVGMLGAIFNEHLLFDGVYTIDLAVYMKPEHRGKGTAAVRMIRMYEEWARKRGVPDNEITLGVSTGIEMERTVCLYERLGYKINSYNMVKKGA